MSQYGKQARDWKQPSGEKSLEVDENYINLFKSRTSYHATPTVTLWATLPRIRLQHLGNKAVQPMGGNKKSMNASIVCLLSMQNHSWAIHTQKVGEWAR